MTKQLNITAILDGQIGLRPPKTSSIPAVKQKTIKNGVESSLYIPGAGVIAFKQ